MKIIKPMMIMLFSVPLSSLAQHLQMPEWENAPDVFMPYAPVITASGGTTVYLAGVTAAPVYHSHPHVPSEFDDIPLDMEGQARLVLENIKAGLEAAGAEFSDVVAATRYFTTLEPEDQNTFNRIWGEYFGDHRPTTTTVQVVRLATDPRCLVEVTVTANIPGQETIIRLD